MKRKTEAELKEEIERLRRHIAELEAEQRGRKPGGGETGVDDSGTLIGIASTERDIPERKRAEQQLRAANQQLEASNQQLRATEQQLRESEQFTRAVLDNLPVGIAVNSVDPAVEFSYMNDSFPMIYRTTREALADSDVFWEVVYEDPTFREELKKRVLDDCASGDPKRMSWEDVPITRVGKGTSFVSARNIPVPGKGLSISMVWDVTERKQAEEAINESRRRLIEAQRIALLGDFEWNVETGKVTWSESLFELLGYDTSENIDYDKVNASIHHPDDLEEVTRWLQDAIASSGDILPPNEYRLVRKNGETIQVRAVGRIVRQEGKKPIVFAIVQDVTERKQREERIYHLTEVLRAVRNVNQLITHEKDPDVLLRRACEILTETRGYRSAWIGLRLPDGGLRAAGESGIGEGFQAIHAKLEQKELPECCKKAMGGADIVVTHDTMVNCVRCPLAKSYRDASALCGLLHHADNDYGFLVVALPADVADDDEEKSLFRELAGDIGYALFSIEADRKRKQAEEELSSAYQQLQASDQQLRASNQQLEASNQQLRATETALRDSEQAARALMDATMDAAFLMDVEGTTLVLNDQFARRLGRSKEELIGSNIYPLLPPGIAERRKVWVAEVVRTGKPLEEEDERGGRFLHNIVYPVFDRQGRVTRLAVFSRDITERRRDEEELRKHRDHLEELLEERTAELRDLNLFSNTILDTSPVGIVTYRTDGQCASANESAGPLIGATREQVLDQNFRALKSWRESDLLAAADRCLETGEPRRSLFTTRTSFGKDVILDTRFSRFAMHGEPHLLLTFNDITDRVRAEEALKRYSAQLEAANRELEAFAYSVSHDLRAPLRSINGFSEALLEDYADKVDEQGKDHLRRVRAGAQRMAELIEDLLKLSRITRWEMEHRKVDISALARKTVASLRQAQPERDVDVVIEDGLVADGDIRLLRVVMENLLGNAWKFSGRTANARIEVGKGEISDDGYRMAEGQDAERKPISDIRYPKSIVAYFVRDNGAGFDMAYVDKLFGAFQRLHSAAEFEGSGIGLATVQRAVLRHGGRVWAEGEEGKGATFYFTLGA